MILVFVKKLHALSRTFARFDRARLHARPRYVFHVICERYTFKKALTQR